MTIASRAALLLACIAPLVGGCVGAREPGAPIYVGIHPYAGPGPDARGDVVVSYHPWTRRSVDKGAGKGGTTFAETLDEVTVRCRNVQCQYDGRSHRLTVKSPPEGLANIEVTLQKEGFDPIEMRVPVAREEVDQNVLVVLTPARPK